MEYAIALEKTLSSLEAHLHESDDPEAILNHTLATACRFYGGDWAGFIEVDLELGLWTPFMWYNPGTRDKTTILLEDVEASDHLERWIKAMHENLPVIIEDAETVKTDFPDEYEVYRRLGVNSVIAVPVKPRPTGFLIMLDPHSCTTDINTDLLTGIVSSQVKYRNFRQKVQSFLASIISCNGPVVG